MSKCKTTVAVPSEATKQQETQDNRTEVDTISTQVVQLDEVVVKQIEAEELEDNNRKVPHRKSFFQWIPTDDSQLAKSEKRMLANIKDVIVQTTVAGLNTIQTTNPDHKRHLVLLHGFAGGVANWLPNWKALVKYTNVYAIDLPGFARSHRPSVKFPSATDAIEFMTDSILAWLKEMKLDKVKIDLCGHSFGGYISANFAIRYPHLVERLILTDPWGCQYEHDRKLPFKYRVALKLFYTGNPLSLLRGFGPWGPTLLPRIRKDFADRWKPHIEDPNDFYDYTFHCNAVNPPIGEQAFQACCTGAAFAKHPLEKIVPEGLDKNVELTMIYGSHTWMDTGSGGRLLDAVKAKGGKVHKQDMRRISNAGHQVMSDNAPEYNTVLLEVLDYHTYM